MNMDKECLYFMLVNTYGQLIFNKNVQNDPSVDINTLVNLASIFFTIDNLSSTTIPTVVEKNEKQALFQHDQDNKLQTIVSEGFRITCFHTLTNLRFVLVTRPGRSYEDSYEILRTSYQIYSDYVSKDPFYVQGQPVKNKMFDKELQELLKQ